MKPDRAKDLAIGRPDTNAKGALHIRTLFGEVSVDYFPSLTPADMIENAAWRRAVQTDGGPFCYTDDERLLPF